MARTKQTARKLGKGVRQVVQQQQMARSLFDNDDDDEERDYEQAEIEAEMEEENDAMDEIFNFDDNPSYEGDSLVINWSSIMFNNQFMFSLAKQPSSAFLKAKRMNFTGLESACDFLFYQLGRLLKSSQSQSSKTASEGNLDIDGIVLNGCKNVNIWSLHYLYQAVDKSIFDLSSSSVPLKERVAGCDLIGETLCLSFSQELGTQLKEELGIVSESKVLIMNEANQEPFLADFLVNNRSNKTTNKLFKHAKLEIDQSRTLNLIEFNQDFSGLFLTEPNLIVLPFQMDKPDESIVNSVFNRLILAMTKTVITTNVLILGIGKPIPNKIENLKKSISAYLKKLQSALQKTLDANLDKKKKSELSTVSDFNYEFQVYLSQIVNLIEQINLIDRLLRYQVVDFDQKSNKKEEKKAAKKVEENNGDQNNYELIGAVEDVFVAYNNVSEITSLAYPHSWVNMVGEAMCLIAARKPNFANFKSLLNESNFLNTYISSYDAKNMSDYVHNELKIYVDNPNFVPDKIREVSKTAGAICKWILVSFDIASKNKEQSELTSIPDMLEKQALIDRFDKYSLTCYSLAQYYDDMLKEKPPTESNSDLSFYYASITQENRQRFREMCDRVKEIDFKKTKFHSYEDFSKLFKGNDELVGNMTYRFFDFPNKFLRSNCAQGNFHFIDSEKSKFIVTDLNWLSTIVDAISTHPKSNKDDRELRRILGKNVPIWKRDTLREHLKPLIDENKFEDLLDYLDRHNLILRDNDDELIVPINMLTDFQNVQIEEFWPKIWDGLEFGLKWNLFNILPKSSFNKMLQKFFDLSSSKTKLLWNNGFINEECGCVVLVIYTDFEVTLRMRVLDGEKILNIPRNRINNIAKSVFMDYYLAIQEIFVDSKIAFKINFVDKFNHPCVDKPSDSLDDEAIFKLDRSFFANKLQFKHDFKFKSGSESCSRCYVESGAQYETASLVARIYKNFKFDYFATKVENSGEKKTKHSLIEIYSKRDQTIKSVYSFNSEHFRRFQCDFIEKSYEFFIVNLVLDIFNGTSTVLIDLNRRTHTVYSSGDKSSIQLKNTTLFAKNSPEDKDKKICTIKQGDRVWVELRDFTSKSVYVSINYNLEEIASYVVILNGKTLSIRPEIKIEAVEGQAKGGTKKKSRIMLSTDSVSIQSVADYFARTDECNNQLNPKAKEKELIDYVKSNHLSICENMKTYMNSLENGVRGFAILPRSIDALDQNNLNYLHQNLDLHMFCLNCHNFTRIQKSFLYCHLIDMKGLPLKKDAIDMKTILFIALSSFMISNAENSIILPKCEEIFGNFKPDDKNKSKKHLGKKLRKYFFKIFQTLIIYFDLEELKSNLIDVEMKNLMSSLSQDDLRKEQYEIVGKCAFCQKCDFSYYTPVTLQEKLTNQYANCVMILGIRHNYGDRDKPEDGLTIDEEFVEKFNEIKYLGVIDRPLTIKQPEEIFNKLKCLSLIDFSNNNIQEIPDSLLQTNSLLSLTIENNPIKSLKSASFKQLRHLKNLELTNLSLNKDRLGLSGAELIILPSRLESFDFSRMPFDSIPFDFGECKTSLTKLNFSGVRWPLVEEYGGVNAMITHEQIAKAYCNLMNEDELAKVFRYFDTNGAAMKGVLQRKEMLKLAAFVFKRFARLRPTQASPSGVPDVIFELKNLTLLNLSFQGIKFIPDTIENLTNLRILTLDNCILLESISPRIGNLPIEELSLSNCLSLKTPPPEIVRRGKTSVMAYLKRLSTGSVTCKRTKLMLVGLGEAGKTSLVNSLVESASKAMKKPEITDGIVIKDWTIPLPDQTNLTYSIWDFAGQSVYYNSHQFFLSSRAVYFLVWNVRLGSEYAGLDFWLSSISCHAPGAPIFVVGTHIDEVSKYTLNQEKLKSKYNQIVAFYFISNKTKAGVNELVNRLIDTTLREKYMGEDIPEVWLNFEKEIKIEGERRSLMNYDEVKASAEKSGIYDEQEVLQAVRFLSDLGSLQYFENNGLKDKVVINPQWIVDVISCVVSVKESPIKDGKLYHKDIPVIWKRFDASLYDWILKLTEEFDLTYRLEIDDSKRVEDNNGQMSIVPCMLPDDELNLDWSDINEYSIDREVKEFRVLYSFAYLPAGLFNRIQVRLFQYADTSSIWKNGSLLRKNKNKALITTNIEAGTIDVRVQGRKPDNVVFLIHEVIETLINESFNGLQYDFSFSCPECVDFQSSHPALFSSSILRRAYELKAPFLQCSERFHAISIQEMLNIMPIEGLSNIDTNLERSLGDLKQMRRALKHDIFVWYCEKDTKASAANCNPLELIEAIRKERYDIWSPSKPAEEKMDRVTVAIKESRMAVLAISDEFANDERCLQVFELVKNIIKKPYLIVEFGTIGAHKWLENSQFVSVCSEFRIIMQDRKRYAAKLVETLDAVERHLSEIKIDKTVLEIRPDVFISYCWSNSHDAVKKGTKAAPTSLGWFDPRALAKLFEENEIRTWLDVTEVGSATNTSLFSDITKGMNAASVVIACFSDEYALSKNCVLEFRFAHVSLKLPIVKAVVGTGDEWRRNEIAFLAGSYPEVNLQYENPTGLKRLVELVKEELKEKKKSQSTAAVNKTANQLETESQEADSTNSAYQEIYELTQRKFLKQLTKYSSKMQQSREHPRLLCIDLINAQRAEELMKFSGINRKKLGRKWSIAIRVNPNIVDDSKPPAANKTTKSSEENEDQSSQSNDQLACIRVMCEHENEWHLSNTLAILPEPIATDYSAYLARIMRILKSGSLANDMQIFACEAGAKLLADIETKAVIDSGDGDAKLAASYTALRKFYIESYEAGKVACAWGRVDDDLSRCEMKNGKILWLCKRHVAETNARVLNNANKANQHLEVDLNSEMLNDLDQIEIEL